MLQAYIKITATVYSLTATTIVAYPVQLVFLKFSKLYYRFLMDQGHILLAVLSVSTAEVCRKYDFAEPEDK